MHRVGKYLALIALCFCLTACAISDDGGVKNIANRVSPQSDWTLLDDQFRPKSFFNFDDVSAPSVHRRWEIPRDKIEESFIFALKEIDPNQTPICQGEGIETYCMNKFSLNDDGHTFNIILSAESNSAGVILNFIVYQ